MSLLNSSKSFLLDRVSLSDKEFDVGSLVALFELCVGKLAGSVLGLFEGGVNLWAYGGFSMRGNVVRNEIEILVEPEIVLFVQAFFLQPSEQLLGSVQFDEASGGFGRRDFHL